jgi:hypothetical protein
MIEALVALVEAIDAAAEDARALDPLLTTLADRSSGLFSCAVLFKGGYAGEPFVLAAVHGSSPRGVRSWMRWPLRRLFLRRKPSRILSPVKNGSSALAIPFSYGTERYVVLAPLSERAASAQFDSFFRVIESLKVQDLEFVPLRSSEIPATPMNPSILGFAICARLRERIDAVLAPRGWSCEHIPTFAKLWRLLRESPPDIVVVDTDELVEPLSAITSIHRFADGAALRLVAIGDNTPASAWTLPLIDRLLPHETDGESVFKLLKELARASSVLRRTKADEADAIAHRQASTSLSFDELAYFTAHRAAELMQGWAYCALVDDYGVVSRAESPPSAPLVLSRIPKAFLSDTPIFDLRVTARFLAEITDDSSEQIAMMSLHPLSGAAVPIVSTAGVRLGVLVTCSREGWADSDRFESVDRLCRVVAARCDELQPDAHIPEFRQEPFWNRLRDRSFGLDVYRSRGCLIPWRYRVLDEKSALLTLGLSDDGVLYRRLTSGILLSKPEVIRSISEVAMDGPSFAAAIDFSTKSMSYVTQGFSPPIPLDQHRPTTSIGTSGAMTSGCAMLAASGGALVCDNDLWRWLSQHRGIEKVRLLLDRETPKGLATIVTLGSTP